MGQVRGVIRAVTHLDVSQSDIDATILAIRAIAQAPHAPGADPLNSTRAHRIAGETTFDDGQVSALKRSYTGACGPISTVTTASSRPSGA